jgi:hypothetical protein
MNRTWKIQTHRDGGKKARHVKNEVKSLLIIFFDIKGIVHKELVRAGQTVNSAYCSDVLRWLCENVCWLHPELRRQMNWLLHYDKTPSRTSFFKMGFFTKKQHNCRPPSTIPLSVSPTEDKIVRPPFKTQLRWPRQNRRRCWTPSQNTTFKISL